MKKSKVSFLLAFPVRRTHAAVFLTQLSMLSDAGFPMKSALKIAAQKTNSMFFKKIIPEISRKMAVGKYFSDTMVMYPQAFTRHDAGIVKIGEKCGRVSESFAFLSECIQREDENRKKIMSAVSYPIFIAFISAFALFVIVPAAVSVFEIAYSGMITEMPEITRFVIDSSDFLSEFTPYFAVFMLSLFVVYSVLYRKSDRFALKADTLKFKIPFFGIIEKNGVTAKFARTVGWLSDSGCRADEMFSVIASAFSNKRCIYDINAIPEGLSKGISFSETVSHSECFSPEFKESVSMFVDNYDVKTSLFGTADMLEKENVLLMTRFSTVAGIVATLFAAVLVLILVLALILPIFSIDVLI